MFRSASPLGSSKNCLWFGRVGAPLIIGAGPYARLFNPFGAPWSILFDLRSSLLTLGRAQASLALLSLTRSLHLSPFTLHLSYTRRRCHHLRCCHHSWDSRDSCSSWCRRSGCRRRWSQGLRCRRCRQRLRASIRCRSRPDR